MAVFLSESFIFPKEEILKEQTGVFKGPIATLHTNVSSIFGGEHVCFRLSWRGSQESKRILAQQTQKSYLYDTPADYYLGIVTRTGWLPFRTQG